jgi:transcriptional regulator with XRE-family HTH domain
MQVADIFARRVGQRLEELGLTHESFAQLVGTNRTVVTKTLREGRAPRIDTLVKWASMLEVPPQWLLGAADMTVIEKPSPPPTREEKMLYVLEEMGLGGKRFELARFALLGTDAMITTLHKELAAFEPLAALHQNKRSSGA